MTNTLDALARQVFPALAIVASPREADIAAPTSLLDPTRPDEIGRNPTKPVDFRGLEAISFGRAEADTSAVEPREGDPRWTIDGSQSGQIAEYLGISKDSVYAWIEKKDCQDIASDGSGNFKRSEVDAWVHEGKAADPQRDDD